MIFALIAFGCKTNQYETEAIREQLLAAGHRESPDPAAAEVVLVNTCTVTGRADATWRNAVSRAARENPAARIVLLGCAVDVSPALADDPRIEAVFPNRDKGLVAAYFAADAATPLPAAPAADGAAAADPRDSFSLRVRAFAGHTRAFLKIQDGCDNRCSYCIIPRARGAGRSRPAADILAEARGLAAAGYRELVLTGINIGCYRHEELRLAELVRELAAVPGVARLRLGSVEPQEVTAALLAAMAECPNVCPHLHLPLQSGSAEILRRMNRRYTLDEYRAVLARIRAAIPAPAVTTDIITGFPGETAEQAGETLDTVRESAFARSHVFLFSPRAGTPAAAMRPTRPGLVDERRKILTLVCGETAAAYAASLVGRVEEVLVETLENGAAAGYGGRYLRTVFPAPPAARPGDIVPVRITAAEGAELRGEAAV